MQPVVAEEHKYYPYRKGYSHGAAHIAGYFNTLIKKGLSPAAAYEFISEFIENEIRLWVNDMETHGKEIHEPQIIVEPDGKIIITTFDKDNQHTERIVRFGK